MAEIMNEKNLEQAGSGRDHANGAPQITDRHILSPLSGGEFLYGFMPGNLIQYFLSTTSARTGSCVR